VQLASCTAYTSLPGIGHLGLALEHTILTTRLLTRHTSQRRWGSSRPECCASDDDDDDGVPCRVTAMTLHLCLRVVSQALIAHAGVEARCMPFPRACPEQLHVVLGAGHTSFGRRTLARVRANELYQPRAAFT